MKIEIELDDDLYALALEWREKEKLTPFPPEGWSENKIGTKMYNIAEEAWCAFLFDHGFLKRRRRKVKFLGIDIGGNYEAANKTRLESFRNILSVLKETENFPTEKK